MFEQFAAERTSRLSAYDDELLPVVRRALKDFKSGTAWYAPIVDKAEELFFTAGGQDSTTGFLKQLRATLGKTKDPDTTAGDTDVRLAKWVATYIVNAAEESSAGEGTVKTWITMHDDRVRTLHQQLDGRSIPSDQKFDVGGARLSYPGEPVGDPAGWINCRCLLKVTKENEMSLTADVGPSKDAENVIPKGDPADELVEAGDEKQVDDDTSVPFHGVATVTDKPTGDRRQLSSEGFAVRPMPLPVFYQRAQSEGHAGSTIVGQFTRMELNPAGEVEYDGFFNFTPEAGEAIQGVAEGWLRGVSVDLDDTVIDMEASTPVIPDGATDAEAMDIAMNAMTVFKQWRVSGLTMVGIPAFHEAYIALGPRPVADEQVPHEEDGDGIHDGETVPRSQAGYSASTATFAPGTHDGPGWITAPVPTGRIRRYWTHGEGAAKIKWGVPGDFNRCRSQLVKYIANPDWLAGACANMHKEATGGWPGHAPTEASIIDNAALVASAFNLVAAAPPRELPPAEWFQDPKLEGPTPITIEGERIFGHIATWGTCHLGLPGQCTTAPYSATDYAWFRLGGIETSEGVVPVGQITMQTGHAGPRANVKQAAAHYDNTGTAVADIATGEDAHGIWFAGRLRPGLTEGERAELLGAKLSGDWREVNHNLELVAALAVNTPGFGIPRISLAASGQEQLSLVAAGMVMEEKPLPIEEQIRLGIERALDRRDRLVGLAQRTARLRELAAQQRHARLEAARSRFGR